MPLDQLPSLGGSGTGKKWVLSIFLDAQKGLRTLLMHMGKHTQAQVQARASEHACSHAHCSLHYLRPAGLLLGPLRLPARLAGQPPGTRRLFLGGLRQCTQGATGGGRESAQGDLLPVDSHLEQPGQTV